MFNETDLSLNSFIRLYIILSGDLAIDKDLFNISKDKYASDIT